MATPAGVSAVLAGAKKTLADADKFSASLPRHEYSDAPYQMARGVSKPKADGKEAESIVSGLKWRAEQKKAVE